MTKPRNKKVFLTLYLPIAAFLIFALIPLLWMLITSLKPTPEIYKVHQFPFIVRNPTLEHYIGLTTKMPFFVWIKNSFVVAVTTTILTLSASVPAAYALARLNFKGGNLIALSAFVMYLIPRSLLFIPLMKVVVLFKIYNSLFALIFTYLTFLVPFGIWLLLGYFRALPREIEDCALIDGCNKFQVFYKIAVPLVAPGLVTVSLFAFLESWNEFLYALTFVHSDSVKTLPVGVFSEMVRADILPWGSLMAASVVGSFPIVILYSLFADRFIRGMTLGAVKG